jgi:hypothetical protein
MERRKHGNTFFFKKKAVESVEDEQAVELVEETYSEVENSEPEQAEAPASAEEETNE